MGLFSERESVLLSCLFFNMYYFPPALLLSQNFLCKFDYKVGDEVGCYFISVTVCFQRLLIVYFTTHMCFAHNPLLDLLSPGNLYSYVKLVRAMAEAVLNTNTFVCHRRYIILSVDSVLEWHTYKHMSK